MRLTFLSCRVSRIDVSGSRYSTGHMGMSVENIFVFRNANQFYYYKRLGYSEGTFEWVNDKTIRLASKLIGFLRGKSYFMRVYPQTGKCSRVKIDVIKDVALDLW